MVIKNKKTYLLLVVAVLLCVSVIYFFITKQNLNILASLLACAFVCGYLFIKLNTHSRYLNPDHPKK